MRVELRSLSRPPGRPITTQVSFDRIFGPPLVLVPDPANVGIDVAIATAGRYEVQKITVTDTGPFTLSFRCALGPPHTVLISVRYTSNDIESMVGSPCPSSIQFMLQPVHCMSSTNTMSLELGAPMP